MNNFEVPEPILNSPFEAPKEHWHIVEGALPERRPGRRPAMYFYRDPKARPDKYGQEPGTAIELKLVNRIRDQVAAWRNEGYPGASRTTIDLLSEAKIADGYSGFVRYACKIATATQTFGTGFCRSSPRPSVAEAAPASSPRRC